MVVNYILLAGSHVLRVWVVNQKSTVIVVLAIRYIMCVLVCSLRALVRACVCVHACVHVCACVCV